MDAWRMFHKQQNNKIENRYSTHKYYNFNMKLKIRSLKKILQLSYILLKVSHVIL